MKIGDFLDIKKLSVIKRREYFEDILNIKLSNIGVSIPDEEIASQRNCENMIGAVQVPLGIAGPLLITNNESQTTDYYIPLATTEGALVASVGRGCKAISLAGGVKAQSFRAGVTRGPVFKVKNIEHNNRLYDYIEKNSDNFKKIATETSKHINLIGIDTKSTGLYRFVRFTYNTQDAMGMNMVTIATDAIVKNIEQSTKAVCTALSGNFCVDKKPSWQNIILNRGFEVWAEVVLNQKSLILLKTNAKVLYETWLSKCMIGSAMSGSMGFNAHFANVLAAIFLATGQDIAHVAECAVGMTTMDIIKNNNDEDLYVSVYLPDLMIGTIGGGTGLSAQKESLSIMGVCGGSNGDNSHNFARIIGSAVLAGEISLLASLSEGSLARAHERLGRGKNV